MMAHAFIMAALGACSTIACAGKAPLPDVDSVLTKASLRAHDFTEQARLMQQRLDEEQQKSRAALATQKKQYEKQLSALRAQSQAITDENSDLEAANNKTEQANAVTLEECNALEGRNAKMRDILKNISAKVTVANQFLEDSLKVTDDSDAKELAVLSPTTLKPTLDNFLAVTRGDKISLLGLGNTSHGDDPKDLVHVLSNSLTEISTAQSDGAAELKAYFVAELEKVRTRQAALNTTQAELRSRQARLQERRSSLLAAKAHLEKTNTQLNERIRSLGVFADTVGGSVASTLEVDAAAVKVSNASVKGSNASTESIVNQSAIVSMAATAPNPTSAAVDMVKSANTPSSTGEAPVYNLRKLRSSIVDAATGISSVATRAWTSSNVSEARRAKSNTTRAAANSSSPAVRRSAAIKKNRMVKRMSANSTSKSRLLRARNQTNTASITNASEPKRLSSITAWRGWLTHLRF